MLPKVPWWGWITIVLFLLIMFTSLYSTIAICSKALFKSPGGENCGAKLRATGLSLFTPDRNIDTLTNMAKETQDNSLRNNLFISIIFYLGFVLFVFGGIFLIILKGVAMFSSDAQFNIAVKILTLLTTIMIYGFMIWVFAKIYFPQGDYRYPGQGIINFIRNLGIFIRV